METHFKWQQMGGGAETDPSRQGKMKAVRGKNGASSRKFNLRRRCEKLREDYDSVKHVTGMERSDGAKGKVKKSSDSERESRTKGVVSVWKMQWSRKRKEVRKPREGEASELACRRVGTSPALRCLRRKP